MTPVEEQMRSLAEKTQHVPKSVLRDVDAVLRFNLDGEHWLVSLRPPRAQVTREPWPVAVNTEVSMTAADFAAVRTGQACVLDLFQAGRLTIAGSLSALRALSLLGAGQWLPVGDEQE